MRVATGAHGRLITVPNALSVARLLGVPVFVWLILVEADALAITLLALAGLSDWLDGRIARAWPSQASGYGEILDPAADRLYILATLAGLLVRGIVPWWLAALLVVREAALGVMLVVLRRHGYGPPRVHFIGKAATLCLLYAFPMLFLGVHDGWYAELARVVGWAFAIWGTALYWWAGGLYAAQARRLVAADRRRSPPDAADLGEKGASTLP